MPYACRIRNSDGLSGEDSLGSAGEHYEGFRCTCSKTLRSPTDPAGSVGMKGGLKTNLLLVKIDKYLVEIVLHNCSSCALAFPRE